jgi:hypothetical protein
LFIDNTPPLTVFRCVDKISIQNFIILVVSLGINLFLTQFLDIFLADVLTAQLEEIVRLKKGKKQSFGINRSPSIVLII